MPARIHIKKEMQQVKTDLLHFSRGDHFMLASSVLLGLAAEAAGEAPGKGIKYVLSWSKRLDCFAKQDPGRARQSN